MRDDGLIRDRDGELVEADQRQDVHDPRCRGGWLGERPDGAVIPCLACRPHLADRLPRRPAT